MRSLSANETVRGLILAAGLGRRLFPLSLFRAKPAIPFLNRPLVLYSLELLRKAGVGEIVVNLHHLPETVRQALGASIPDVVFSFEETLLGTAGAIGCRRELFGDRTLVVCNGKIYFEEDLAAVLRFHRETQAAVTLVVIPHRSEEGFSPVFVDDYGNVKGFAASSRSEPAPGERAFTFSGVHVLSAQVLDQISAGYSDSVGDLYPRLLQQGYPVKAFTSQAYWCECSTPFRYLAKSMEVLARKGLDKLLESPLQARCRGVIAGAGVNVERGCLIENSVLWDDVEVSRNSSLRGAIIAAGVRLPPETHLQGAVVTPRLPSQNLERDRGWVCSDYFVCPLL